MSTLKEVIAAIVNLAISERIVKLVRYSLLISFNLVMQIAYDFFFSFSNLLSIYKGIFGFARQASLTRGRKYCTVR